MKKLGKVFLWAALIIMVASIVISIASPLLWG